MMTSFFRPTYGKNISPVPIESALKASPLITQALVVGDGRPFLSAILVIDCEAANRLLAGLDLPLRPVPSSAIPPSGRRCEWRSTTSTPASPTPRASGAS